MSTEIGKTSRNWMPKGQYYRSLMKSFFLIGFVLPVLPMIVVGLLMLHHTQGLLRADVDLKSEGELHQPAQGTPTNRQSTLLNQRAEKHAVQAIRSARRYFALVASLVGLGIAVYAFNLSKKMVRKIQEADRKKQLMIEKMFQTGKLASIGELAAGIAHEVNNPVAIMVEEAGWVGDLLEDETLSSEKNRREITRALRQIRRQGIRCKDITKNLLSFARVSDFKVSRISIRRLIKDTLSMAAEPAKKARVKMRMEIPDDLPRLNLPETELQQVVLNLINNALDSMEPDGGQLTIRVCLGDDTLLLAITDTGVGIPAGHLSRIFDPFYTTKPVGKGTGLGLSICYGIVEKMNGTIRVESVEGRGSTFHVAIPVNAPRLEGRSWASQVSGLEKDRGKTA